MSTCTVISSLSNAYAGVADTLGQGVAALRKVGQEVEAGWDSLAQGASAVYTEVGAAAHHTYDGLLAGAKAVGQVVDAAGDAMDKVGETIDDYDCGLLDLAKSVADDIGSVVDVLV